jgi:putative ATPase
MTLFEGTPPLAARMRPRTLDDIVGQEHVIGPGTMLRTLIERDELRSAILWGPAGTGKTTIAHIVADRTRTPVEKLSAVSSGVADVRKVIQKARTSGRIVLFIDEIHRFNKTQQDALLGAVEDGVIVLVGATTENPFFEVNSPLMSRSLLFRLEPLQPAHVRKILDRALGALSGVTASDEALEWIAEKTGGDARIALNALEAGAEMALERGDSIALVDAQAAMELRIVRYDKAGDRHYDVISAFIKSMRGSDPDAALYWLAEMLEAGEDPRFIVRRMVIFASEDVGMADPNALPVAVAAAHALEHVGLPEAQLNMAHAAIYLATAPKSGAVKFALGAAFRDVRERSYEVPVHLVRQFPTKRGAKYRDPHHEDDSAQQYRPPELEGRRYYEPDF